MSFEPGAVWDVGEPLEPGLAIRRPGQDDEYGEWGTLGPLIRIDGRPYFCAAAHVIGKVDGVAIEVYARANGSVAFMDPGRVNQEVGLRVVTGQHVNAGWGRSDLGLLEVTGPASQLAWSGPVSPKLPWSGFNPTLRYRSARSTRWSNVRSVGRISRESAAKFAEELGIDVELELGCFELCESESATTWDGHPGESGSGVWTYVRSTRSYHCLGHVVAVERTAPDSLVCRRVVVLRYANVFDNLGFDGRVEVAV